MKSRHAAGAQDVAVSEVEPAKNDCRKRARGDARRDRAEHQHFSAGQFFSEGVIEISLGLVPFGKSETLAAVAGESAAAEQIGELIPGINGARARGFPFARHRILRCEPMAAIRRWSIPSGG